MNRIKHILFDCDGVLVDTEYIAALKMREALEARGITIDFNSYLQEHSGTTFSAIFEYYFGETMTSEERYELMMKVEDDVAAEVKTITGIPELLRNISKDKSVVSNSSIATVRHALKVTGIQDNFNGRIFSSEQVPNAKPAPDLYLFAIQSLGLQPDEMLVVEDSPAGAKAAVSAGLKVIGFTGASHILPGHDEKLKSLGAVATASNAEELNTIIESIIL
ncbi:MAG: HAD family phosphatase [Bacteroidota bacterium]